MSAITETLALLAFVIFGSYLLTKALLAAKRVKISQLDLQPGQIMRILTPTGSYRCFLVGDGQKEIRVGAPIHNNSHVPLRVGENVVVQSPGIDSLLTFRTTVKERDLETHELVLTMPTSFRRTDRRCEPRLQGDPTRMAKLNSVESMISNLSAWGAKVVTNAAVVPGDLVALEILPNQGRARGYALDTKTAAWNGQMCREVRIRFDEPLSGIDFMLER